MASNDKSVNYLTPFIEGNSLTKDSEVLEGSGGVLAATDDNRIARIRSTGNKIYYLTGEFIIIGFTDAGSLLATLPNPITALSPANYNAIIVNKSRWVKKSSGTDSDLNSALFADDEYLVAGNLNGKLLRSVDTTTWTEVSLPSTDAMHAIVTSIGNDIYFIVGHNGTALQAADTSSWSVSGNTGTTETLRAIAFSGAHDLFVAVGGDLDTIITTTTNGTWTLQSQPVGVDDVLNGVSWGMGSFVAVGGNGAIILSFDGVVWTDNTGITVQNLNSVRFIDNQHVAVGNEQTIVVSADGGDTWLDFSMSEIGDIDLADVAFGDGIYIFVGTLNGMFDAVYSSTDLLTYTKEELPDVGVIQGLTSVIFDGDEFVITGTEGQIYVSTFDSNVSSFPIGISGNQIVTELDSEDGDIISLDGVVFIGE